MSDGAKPEPGGEKPSPLEFDPSVVRARGALTVRWRPIIRALAVLLAGLVAALFIEYPLVVTAPCQFAPGEQKLVRAELDGVLLSIDVIEGATVVKGQVLGRLDDRELRADLTDIRSGIEAATTRLELARHGARREEIQKAQQVLASRQSQLDAARTRLTRWKTLHASKVASNDQLQDAERAVVKAIDAAREAQASLDFVRAGSREQEIAALELALQKLRSEEAYVNAQLARVELVSPLDGIVVTPRIHERAGERVALGAEIIRVVSGRRLRVDVQVPQTELDALRVGLPVITKASGFPDHRFSGKVDFISPAAEMFEGRHVVRVTSSVDAGGQLIRYQMTGIAEIDAGQRPLYRLAWRRLMRLFWLSAAFTS